MAKIVILTEGGSKMGFGHITRCSAIYDAFVQQNMNPLFLVNADNSACGVLEGRKYTMFNWLNDQDRLSVFAKDADAIIVDSYLTPSSFYKKIAAMAKEAVYIDDYNRIKYPSGIVINGSINAKELNYPKTKGTDYLLGPEYLPLRKEYWDVPDKKIRKDVNTVMVAFGGDDSANMTPRVLEMLAAEFHKLTQKVIVGRGFSKLDEIKKAASSMTELIYYPDAVRMRDVMSVSDIAVSAGGQTLYELARVGVPTIAVIVAENQLNNVMGCERADFIYNAGRNEGDNVMSNISIGIKKMDDMSVRMKMSEAGRRHVDGNGSIRISDFIINRMKKKGMEHE